MQRREKKRRRKERRGEERKERKGKKGRKEEVARNDSIRCSLELVPRFAIFLPLLVEIILGVERGEG